MNKRMAAILEASVMLILLSFGSVLTKIVLYDIKPFTYTWTTVGIGMIIISLYTFVIRKEKIPRKMGKQIWWFIIIIGIGNFVLSNILRPFAIQRLPVITSTYLGNFVGFVTMAFSIFMLGEFPSIFQVIGAIVAFLGITIFFNQPMEMGEVVGIILIVISIIVTAVTNNVTRKMGIVTDNKYSNNILSALAILIGGTAVVLAGLLFDFPPKVPDIQSWGIIAFAGAINVALYITVWNNINRVLKSFEASILGASTIIYTTFFAMIILSESLTTNKWLGMGTMVVGLLLVQVRAGGFDKIFKKKTNAKALQGLPVDEVREKDKQAPE